MTEAGSAGGKGEGEGEGWGEDEGEGRVMTRGDARIEAYREGNRKWAESENHISPIPFKQMQKIGREKVDGTVIVVACTDPRVTPEEFLGMSAKDGNTLQHRGGKWFGDFVMLSRHNFVIASSVYRYMLYFRRRHQKKLISTEATIIRTAGGRVRPALSTLLVLSAVGNLGRKGVIMVIHHTDCGLQTVDDDGIREALLGACGSRPAAGTVESGDGGRDEAGEEKDDAVRQLKELQFGSFTDPEESVREDVGWLKESRQRRWFGGMKIWGGVLDTEKGILKEVVGVDEGVTEKEV